MDENRELKFQLNLAWTAGILYILAGIPETVVEVMRQHGFIPDSAVPAVTTVYLAGLITGILFGWGFVVLGRKHENPLLWMSAMLLIFAQVFFTGYDMASLHHAAAGRGAVLILDSLLSGALCILFGAGLWRLRTEYGSPARTAGILNILAGLMLVPVIPYLAGLILLIPAAVFEIVLLYRARRRIGSVSS